MGITRNRPPAVLPDTAPTWPLTIAICLLSASSLGYEIILLRQLSYGIGHLFASMTISLALLGVGAGGTFLTLFRTRLAEHFSHWMPIGSAGFGLTAIACPFIAFRLGFIPDSFMWDPWQLIRLATLYGLLSVPFFFSGSCVGLALSVMPKSPDRIYRADMLGAGAGGTAALASLSFLPPEIALKAVSLGGFLAAALFLVDSFRRMRLPSLQTVVVVAAILFILPGAWLSPRLSPYKPLSKALNVPGATIAAEKQGLWGGCVAVSFHEIPIRHAPGMSLLGISAPPKQTALFSDGEPSGVVTHLDESETALAFFDSLPSGIPYILFEHPSVLVLKAGGGFRVLEALYHGSKSVKAVEPNNDINRIADELGPSTGDLFKKPDITRSAISPRAFLNKTDERFDIVITPSVPMRGSVIPVSENHLITKEGIAAIMDRLTHHGIIVTTIPLEVPDRAGFKILATAIAVLKEQDNSPQNQLAAILSPTTVTLLVARAPFSQKKLQRLKHACDEWGFSFVIPGINTKPTNEEDATRYAKTIDTLLNDQSARFIHNYAWDITPPTDDRPFFNVYFKLGQLHTLTALLKSGAIALIDWGWILLLATLGIAVCLSVAFILLPLLPIGKRIVVERHKLWTFTYFSSLGFAFMFLELVSIKKLAFSLGNPVIAAGCIISTFLIFAGLGAGVSRKLCPNGGNYTLGIQAAVAGIVISCCVVLFSLPALQSWISRLPIILQYAVGASLFGPTAFFMGMPFPLGLCILSDESSNLIPWAWAVNGCASVISPLLALVLAVNFGFLSTAIIALCLYLLAAFTVIFKSLNSRIRE